MICLKLIKLSYDYSHSNYDHAYQARSIVFYKVYRCVRGGGAKHKTKQTHHHFANLQNPNPQVGLGDDCSALYRKPLFFLIYRINLYMLLKKWGGGGSSFNFNFLICKFTNEKVAGRGGGQVLCPPSTPPRCYVPVQCLPCIYMLTYCCWIGDNWMRPPHNKKTVYCFHFQDFFLIFMESIRDDTSLLENESTYKYYLSMQIHSIPRTLSQGPQLLGPQHF